MPNMITPQSQTSKSSALTLRFEKKLINHNQLFTFWDDPSIAKYSAIKMSSVTHLAVPLTQSNVTRTVAISMCERVGVLCDSAIPKCVNIPKRFDLLCETLVLA